MEMYLKDAIKIGELQYTLDNISADDCKALTEYTQAEIVNEAKYVLSCFFENGHMNNAWLNGEDGDSAEAIQQVKQLEKFIKKWTI